MRLFQHVLHNEPVYFYQQPEYIDKNTPLELLRFSVGAALYMPAIRTTAADELLTGKYASLTTVIFDLEDALGNGQVNEGVNQLMLTLTRLSNEADDVNQLPLLFVRIRNHQMLVNLTQQLGSLQQLLTGYVLPKFNVVNGELYLATIKEQNDLGYKLYAMPVLESHEILFKEYRMANLQAIYAILIEYYDIILNVRIGATDFCGLFGIRRSIQHAIYDIATVRDCIADILNVFQRAAHYFVVSGPVWEYFSNQLSEDSSALSGLLKELELDKMNGIIGKTVIHPTHIEPVQAMYVVTHEEFIDAQCILLNSDGQIGVQKSEYANKMNEMKPHLLWAQRILQRAKVYGVYKKGITYEHFLKRRYAHETI